MGGARPPTDSIAAEAKRLASANEQGGTPIAAAGNATNGSSANGTSTNGASGLNRSEQSQADKEANFLDAVNALAPKVQDGTVTKEEASLLHSREHKAYGQTEKGGIASQAHKIVAQREKA